MQLSRIINYPSPWPSFTRRVEGLLHLDTGRAPPRRLSVAALAATSESRPLFYVEIWVYDVSMSTLICRFFDEDFSALRKVSAEMFCCWGVFAPRRFCAQLFGLSLLGSIANYLVTLDWDKFVSKISRTANLNWKKYVFCYWRKKNVQDKSTAGSSFMHMLNKTAINRHQRKPKSSKLSQTEHFHSLVFSCRTNQKCTLTWFCGILNWSISLLTNNCAAGRLWTSNNHHCFIILHKFYLLRTV